MQFVIFTDRHDDHVATTLDALRAMLPGRSKIDVHLVDFWPPDTRLSLRFDNDGAPRLALHDRPIDLDAPTLIWPRLKPPAGNPSAFSSLSDRDYAHRQWQHFLMGLIPLFSRGRTLNHNTCANSKPAQLAAAAKVGFAIPPTVIGNDLAHTLAGLGDPILYKPVGYQAHESANTVLAVKLARAAMEGLGANVRQAPAIYQDFIAKDHELRHHVFGGQSFMYRVNSRLNAQTEVDWRVAMSDPDICERAPSSEDIDALCRAFLKEMDLRFGTFDFIVEPGGRLVFLECNPDGQWSALAAATGADMAGALAQVIADEFASMADG